MFQKLLRKHRKGALSWQFFPNKKNKKISKISKKMTARFLFRAVI
jgi:hypothetical protein